MSIFKKNKRKAQVEVMYNKIARCVMTMPTSTIALPTRYQWGECVSLYAYENIFGDGKNKLELKFPNGEEQLLEPYKKKDWEIIETIYYCLQEPISYQVLVISEDRSKNSGVVQPIYRFRDLPLLNDYLSAKFIIDGNNFRYIRTTLDYTLSFGFANYAMLHVVNGKWVRWGTMYVFPELDGRTVSYPINDILGQFYHEYLYYNMIKSLLLRQPTRSAGIFSGKYKGCTLNYNQNNGQVELFSTDMELCEVLNETSEKLRTITQAIYSKPLYVTETVLQSVKIGFSHENLAVGNDYNKLVHKLDTQYLHTLEPSFCLFDKHPILPKAYCVNYDKILQKDFVIRNADYTNDMVQNYNNIYGNTENN